MDCSELSSLLEPFADKRLTSVQRIAVAAHLERCDSCASAAYGLEILRAQRGIAVPTPRPELLSEVVDRAALAGAAAAQRGGDRFWLGAGVGSALAAGIVIALLSFNATRQEHAEASVPQLDIALNETRDVNLAIDSPIAMMNAQIRVVLTGTVALAGFGEQSELRWAADLDRGVNVLSLPVTMLGTSGGQVLVEVTHQDRHEIFVITLRSSTSPRAGEPSIPSATAA